MKKAVAILLAAALMVSLPFLFKPNHKKTQSSDRPRAVLRIITPHNESIRYEFAEAFSKWHNEKYGQEVRIDWRVIGGTTEIMRFLTSEYIGSLQGYCERASEDFPPSAPTAMMDASLTNNLGNYPEKDRNTLIKLYKLYRENDDAKIATSHLDLFFGGGTYDHGKAREQGLTVMPWKNEDEIPPGLLKDQSGNVIIPKELSGDLWHDGYFYGCVLSTFGICWNQDRLLDLGIEHSPVSWRDLTHPKYFGQIGVTDPTKSGSVAKAFELIIHQAILEGLAKRGIPQSQIDTLKTKGFSPTFTPSSPDETNYLNAVSQSWEEGLNLVRLIGANSKYFTDSAGKVPIDVGMGSLAAGIAIDFFGRFQSEYTKTPDGKVHMAYATPKGGSAVSADPISLLRGAQHRTIALRFIEFVLSKEGQAIWNGRVGADGGTTTYALRRLPIRRDFYPSDIPSFNEVFQKYSPIMSDNLASPDVNPYEIAKDFIYHSEWTARHFGIQRDLIRALCLDSGVELKTAWKAILDNGGPEENPLAISYLFRLPQTPVPVNWQSASTDYKKIPRLKYMREWTREIRENYRKAAEIANKKKTSHSPFPPND